MLEVDEERSRPRVMAVFGEHDVPCVADRPHDRRTPRIRIAVGGETVLDDDMRDLRDLWEATSASSSTGARPTRAASPRSRAASRTARTPSFGSPLHAAADAAGDPRAAATRSRWPSSARRAPTATARWPPPSTPPASSPGTSPCPTCSPGAIELDRFRGLAAVGGFSYADVLDSAKGWAGIIRFNDELRRQFDGLRRRVPTPSASASATAASSSPCSAGCRGAGSPTRRSRASSTTPRAASSRASSTVKIEPSPAIMLDGMAGSTLGIWVAARRGTGVLPRPRGPRAGARRRTRAGPLRRRRGPDHRELPLQPQRLARGHRRACAPPTAATWRSCPTRSAAS